MSNRRSDSNNFHYQFDFNNLPMTNPPLFDQSMFYNFNQGGPPTLRRRISISNGQIGQIINHEAIFDENYDLISDAPTPVELTQPQSKDDFNQSLPINQSINQPFLDSKLNYVDYNQKVVPNVPQQQFPAQLPPNPVSTSSNTATATSQPPTVPSTGGVTGPPNGSATTQTTQPSTQNSSEKDHTSFAGVPPPHHQLIYNNEVIFNPNGGPVPGTAAWKRDRLLERNRIAASKCRQRRKQAQQQLLDDVKELKDENEILKAKLENYEKLVKLMKNFFGQNSTGVSFDSIDNFDVISKALKTDNEDDLLNVLASFEPDSNVKTENNEL